MAKKDQDIYAHWRDSALTPRFFTVDARAGFVVLLCMVRPNWYTLAFVIVILTILSILNYYRVTVVASMRLLRSFLTGSKKVIMRRK
jgi:intracellular multiplication protein IcmT